MGFISVFLGCGPKMSVTSQDLEAFVARQIPESLNLEYTAKDSLKRPPEVVREVVAFANSDGGLLVVGVGERKEGAGRVPDKITWDDDPAHTHEWLDSVLLHSIHPSVPGVRIVQVRDPTQGRVHLIDVPPSPAPPHMGSDGRYYYR